MTLTRGTFVTLTIGDWTHPAMVGLASPNGGSIMVLFDGTAPVAGGRMVGMLALLREDDGLYYELATHTAVTVTPRESEGPSVIEGDPWLADADDVSEDRCALCQTFLGFGLKVFHVGMCERCSALPVQ